ncbi:MAG TPA: T9SS type A sorting domain-containing protein, partial [Xanthomarina sp.]|nr:T9SS type A sorting domain-containing protein [Xanthomarina sp.]
TTNPFNYNYWSSPVNRGGAWQIGNLEQKEGSVIFNAAHTPPVSTTNPVTISSRWLYTYDASELYNNGITEWVRINKDTPIKPGIGYTMKGSKRGDTYNSNLTEEYVFSGRANSGEYIHAAVNNNDFLIGNPYPSALNAEQFIIDNLDVIDGTLHFYEHFDANNTHVWRNYQAGYASINLMSETAAPKYTDAGGSKGAPTKYIAVGQGFFVNIDYKGVDNGLRTIKFNNAQREFAKESNGGSVFYKNENSNEIIDNRTKFWLHFTDETGRAREIALGYDERASIGFDRGFDAIDFSDFPDSMLWYTPENLLVIQGLNSFSVEDEIPLAIKITTPGIYTIGLDRMLNFPENTPIYLKDNLNGSFYNLKIDSVSIPFEAGTFNNRFSIVYQRDALGMPTLEENQSVYVKFNKNTDTVTLLGIDNLNEVKTVYMYAMDGKQVRLYENIESKAFDVSHLNDGVYILKLEMSSGAIKNIKFVKY